MKAINHLMIITYNYRIRNLWAANNLKAVSKIKKNKTLKNNLNLVVFGQVNNN